MTNEKIRQAQTWTNQAVVKRSSDRGDMGKGMRTLVLTPHHLLRLTKLYTMAVNLDNASRLETANELKAQFANFAALPPVELATMRDNMASVQLDITGLNTNITRTKTNITRMKTEITRMTTDITGMKNDITRKWEHSF